MTSAQDETSGQRETSGQDDARLHDMGGNIGPADDSSAASDRGEGRPSPTIDPNALAVDSMPDELRTGQWNQDETESVVDTTGEVRHLDEEH